MIGWLKEHILEKRDDKNRRFRYIAHSAGHHGHGVDVHGHAVLHEPGGAQTRGLQLQVGRVVGRLPPVRDVHVPACVRGPGPHGRHVQDRRGPCARAARVLLA